MRREFGSDCMPEAGVQEIIEFLRISSKVA